MSRSSHVRLPALVASATLTLGGLVVLAAPPASAIAPTPDPVCDASACTVTFGYTGDVQSFTVPAAVTELEVRVSGASGGGTKAPLLSPGGEGGITEATMSTLPGTSLGVLVGGAGATAGGRTVGGGGSTASVSYTGSGGGGSFVFLEDGTPAVVSGGGGGGGGASSEPGPVPGGAGAGAGSTAGDGSTITVYNPSTPARGGSSTAGGSGGTNRIPSDGGAGGGPSNDFQPGSGGNGGDYAPWPYYDGGGGGGGYYGGGGGGTGDSGAGGSGYAAPDISIVSSTAGGNTGNGVVTISWARAAQSVAFTSTTGTPRVGETYQVAATGGASGNPVTFDSDTPDVCTVSDSIVSLQKAGTCTVRADQAETYRYTAGTATQSVPVARGDSAMAITSPAPDASVDGPTYDVDVSSSPSTGAVTLSTSDTSICSLSGSTLSFGDVGQCTVTATQAADANYEAGTDSQSFSVAKGAQAITFNSEAPNAAHPGDTFTVAASGGASEEAVTYGSATPTVCSLDGATVTLVAEGTCTVTADQDGDDRFAAAPTAQQDTAVSRVASTVVLTLPGSQPVVGQPVTVHADVSADGSAAAGSVQFTVDGENLSEPTELVAGKATSPTLDVPAGQHDIGAVYLPADTVRVAGSSTSSTLVIGQAATATQVTTDGETLRAEVTPTAPGQGTPSGDVTFRVDGQAVGTAELAGGVAELVNPLTGDSDHGLSAEYAGSDDFLASSGSTSRDNPTITAALSSASGPSTAGWYHSQVTITYTCLTRGADLLTPCPRPVTVSREGATQAVSATINAVDGGIATISSVVSLDRTAPTVKVLGVRDGAAYLGVRPPHSCQSTDALSGVLSCQVTATRGSHGSTILTATALDRAGNIAVDRASYRVNRRNLVGARWNNGAWEVHRGRAYTLAVMAWVRPRLVRAVPAAGRPRHLGARFHRSGSAAGVKRWTRRVTMSMPISRTRTWTIGVRDGRGLHRITVRLVD